MKRKEKKNRLNFWGKVLLAFLLSKLNRRKSNKKIVLTGGNLGEKYEDSVAVFHEYLINHRFQNFQIYWLYHPQTTYVKEKKIPNAVALGSLRNYYLFFRADYSFHGHSITHDIAPGAEQFLFLNKKTVFTHVSHGIEGFKKILIQKEDIPLLKKVDYFNCASQYEMEIKRDQWEIPEDKLIITGFPRFDRYPPNQPASQVKKVLFMTTWREWLFDLTAEEFKESPYFINTMELLHNQKINQLLQEQNVQVTVALHPFMREFEEHFLDIKSDAFQFIGFEELSLGNAIQEMDMLLTDITSVSWDFLYLNKPIIFYLFDQKDWETKRGIYIDLDKDLYGYKAKSSDEVYACLREIIIGGVSYNKWFDKADHYFDFFDQKNCERLANHVFGSEGKSTEADR